MEEKLETSVDEDAFDPERESNKGEAKKGKLSERLKNGLPSNFGRVAGISFTILAIAIVTMIVISSNDDEEVRVSAGTTTEADMPGDSPSAPPIYGGTTVETEDIIESRIEEFEDSSNNATSSISDFEFFSDAARLQEELPVNNDDLFDTNQSLGYIAMSQRPSSRNEVNPDNFVPDVDEVTRDELKKPYDFAKMVNAAAIDIAEWDAEIKRMAEVTNTNVWHQSNGKTINSIQEKDEVFEVPNHNYQSKVVEVVTKPAGNAITEPKPRYTFTPSEIHWVQLVSSCNTDEPGVIGELISGPARNARLLGSCSLTPLKRIFVKFDLMVIGKDQIVPIDTVILSSGEFRQSVEGKVDNHYFARYVPFILANFMGAYADALVTTTSLDDNNGGSVTQVNSIPDTNDQLKFAGGRTLQALLPGLENSLNRPATGYLKQHTIYPLMFRAPAKIL